MRATSKAAFCLFKFTLSVCWWRRWIFYLSILQRTWSKFVSASSVSSMLSVIKSHLSICIINYTDLFTYTVGGYFVCSNFQHIKISKHAIINISRHVLWFICFPVQFWVFGAVMSVAALNSRAIQSEVCKVVVFPLQSTSILIHHFPGSHVETIFRLFSLRTKEMKILEL